MEDCEAHFKSRKMGDIIVGLDAALRECNAQIDGIVEWKSEMQKESKSIDKGD